MHPFVRVVLALGVTSTAAAAGPTVAGPAPDAAQMEVLRDAIAQTPLVRVSGDFGTRWARHVRFDSTGVLLGQPITGRGSVMRSGPHEHEATLIPWDRISMIQTARCKSPGRNEVAGLAFGFAFGSLIALAYDLDTPGRNGTQGSEITIASTLGGLALGAFAGRHEVRTIYPSMSHTRSNRHSRRSS